MDTGPSEDPTGASSDPSTRPELLLATWRRCWGAPLHLAVTHGPDAGWVVPLTGTVTVGRFGSDLAVADAALDHHHLTLQLEDGRLRVRDERSSGGTVLLRSPRGVRAVRRRERRLERALDRGRDDTPPGLAAALARATGRGARVGRRWRTAAPGDELLAGRSRFQVRAGPAHGGTRFAIPAGGSARRRGSAATPRRRLVMVLTLLPALAMLGLMTTGGGASPTLRWLVLGGAGLSLLVTLAVSLRRPHEPDHPPAGWRDGEAAASGPRDPAALALCVAGLGRVDGRWPSLGSTAPAAVGSEVELDGGTVLSRGTTTAGRLTASPAGVAVTGEAAAAVAGWLRAQLDVAGRDDVPVLAGTSAAALPPGPWTLVSADGRCGVAPSWRRAVRLASTPRVVASRMAALLGWPTATGIASAWTAGNAWTDTLAVPIGVDQEGRVREIDLVADGPHALVAGTTGSGKSELLAAWVIALALLHPPRRLQLLLVDYKGGATFAAAARLPHTVGLLTDLDGAASDRALAALRAELRRREHLVTVAGARGVGDLDNPPARLVVVVDELRALVEDSPDRLADLVRLATQGRSLGVHLVLATQRPSGVVDAQLRANVNLRLSLRVLDRGDSVDVLGVPDAADLPPDPGGAYVRSGAGPARIQIAWLPGSAADELVDAAASAAGRVRRARREDLLRVHRPWLPDLPAVVSRSDLPGLLGEGSGDEHGGAAGTPSLPVLLVDEPERQRRTTWAWHDGVVLVSGEPRSGRTTALQALALGELTAGRACHVVSRAGWAPGRETSPGTMAGTVVGTADPRRLQRLLVLLAQGADPAATLVVDDLEQVLESLDATSGPGTGQELLTALLRSGHVARLALATAAPHRWASFATHHLALRVRDVGAAGLVGVPRAFVRPGAPPGRGVLLGGERALEVQVVLDDQPAEPRAPRDGGARGLVLTPLPVRVRLADLLPRAAQPEAGPGAGPWRPVLGVGGDDARAVAAELVAGRPWLVCGPASSGRTGVLRTIAAQCGDPVVLVSPDVPLPAGGADPRVLPGDAVVLVDDAELLDTATADALADLAPRHRMVVATSTTATQTVYRGVVAAVAQARTVLALGGALPPHCLHARGARDPRGGVGRAVLITGTGAVPLQVAHR